LILFARSFVILLRIAEISKNLVCAR